MFDHVSVNVSDYERSRRFYGEALAPLGLTLLMEFGSDAAGFGRDGHPGFWIVRRDPPATGAHVAFRSPDRATVQAFHQAALAAGGVDNGPPGIRAEYHETYYAAFVLDPDGVNVEAVCHGAE